MLVWTESTCCGPSDRDHSLGENLFGTECEKQPLLSLWRGILVACRNMQKLFKASSPDATFNRWELQNIPIVSCCLTAHPQFCGMLGKCSLILPSSPSTSQIIVETHGLELNWNWWLSSLHESLSILGCLSKTGEDSLRLCGALWSGLFHLACAVLARVAAHNPCVADNWKAFCHAFCSCLLRSLTRKQMPPLRSSDYSD